MACAIVPENDELPADPQEFLQRAAASAASVSTVAASLEEAEEFLEKAEAVASQVDRILKGNISAEELRQQDEELLQQEKQNELRLRIKQIKMEEEARAKEEELRRGVEGLGLPSSDFDFYCAACRVEYKGSPGQPQKPLDAIKELADERRCYRCGGHLERREERIAMLNQKLKEAQQHEKQKLLRRQRFKQLQRTAAVARGGAAAITSQMTNASVAAARLPTDYQKWEFFEPESDLEEKSQMQQEQQRLLPPPKATPELTALEKDLTKRSKQQRQLRLQAESFNAKGRQLALAGSWAAASDAFASAVAARPDMLKAQTNLALALLKMEKWEEAETAAGKVLDYAEFIRGGYDKCKDACLKALLRRASARRQLLKLDAARQDAEAALRLSPGNAEAAALLRDLQSLCCAADSWQQTRIQEISSAEAESATEEAKEESLSLSSASETESFFARVDEALAKCNDGLLKQLPSDLAKELRLRLENSADCRAAFCLRTPKAASGKEPSSLLQLQLPRGPARCLLDFATQDIRLRAMRIKAQVQASDAGRAGTSSDTERIKVDSSNKGDREKKCRVDDSCSLALDLILSLCSSDSPPSLYKMMLLPTIPSLMQLVMHDEDACSASVAVLAELSVHSATRKAAANASMGNKVVLEALLHLGVACSTCADIEESMIEKLQCKLSLSPAACQLAWKIRKQANARRPQLLEEARALLCNLSVESPVRLFVLQLLNQQGKEDQGDREYPLLVSWLPNGVNDVALNHAANVLAQCEASLDLLLNLSKETGIRRFLCVCPSVKKRLRDLLKSLALSAGGDDESTTPKRQATAWTPAAARAIAEELKETQRLSKRRQCKRLLLKLLGLLQNISFDSSSDQAVKKNADTMATVSSFLKSLELRDFAQIASAFAGAAREEKEVVLSRNFVVAARALSHQDCAEDAALHQLENIAAEVLISEAALGEAASSALAAAAIRLLCSAALSQNLVLRAAQTAGEHGSHQLSLTQLLRLLEKLLPALHAKMQQRLLSSGPATNPDTDFAAAQRGVDSEGLENAIKDELEEDTQRQREKDDEAALGNCLLLSSLVVKAQSAALKTEDTNDALPKPFRELYRLDLKAVLQSAAAVLKFEPSRHPQVVRNAAICVAAAASSSQRYTQLLREIHALERLHSVAKLFKI